MAKTLVIPVTGAAGAVSSALLERLRYLTDRDPIAYEQFVADHRSAFA